MIVFRAMLVDAYRELNSKRLFWIILALSGMFVLLYGSIGFGDDGMSMFFGLVNIDNPVLTRHSPASAILYRSIFSSLVVPIWLAWVATILALISTTSIFPDFMANGAIDLVLSKPTSRIRLFAMKFATSMLFVGLQVSVFCVGIFFCMGARLGDWEWRLFAAIPVVLLFYSYLYSVNVLLGVVTRSALTALLVTLLLWFSLYATNQAETMLTMVRTQADVALEDIDVEIERERTVYTALDPDDSAASRARAEVRITHLESDRDDLVTSLDRIDTWHRPMLIMQAALPKTSETIALLDRWLRRDTDVNLMDFFSGKVFVDRGGNVHTSDNSNDRETMRRMEENYGSHSEWYVIGTSLAFEAVVLLIAGIVFVRRDY